MKFEQHICNRRGLTALTFSSCSADRFVVAESSVLRISIRAEKPAHRKSANRYVQPLIDANANDRNRII